MTDTALTDRLADAIMNSYSDASAEQLAATLLPVVREYGDQRAAEALESAAAELDDLYESGGAFGADNLRASVRLEKRAATLRGEAGR